MIKYLTSKSFITLIAYGRLHFHSVFFTLIVCIFLGLSFAAHLDNGR
jgi:hypothetical protein